MSLKPLFGFMLVLSSACSVLAQGTRDENPSPDFAIQVRTVVEDIVMIDKAGKPVLGLKKEDFRVFENGKAQAISFLESSSRPTEDSAEPLVPLPNTFTNDRFEGSQNVTNVLLLDALDSWPEDQ